MGGGGRDTADTEPAQRGAPHIEESGIRFALLGSSARKLKTAGTNLLAGRALRKVMYPLTAAELGDDFDLDQVLQYGTIPLVWVSDERREALESYTQLYLREEIRAEAVVRNLAGFVRFLPIAALMHAQLVNAAGIARDAGVARSTVNGYLEILEDTLVATRLPALDTKLRVRERRRPKLYWVDPGLVRAIKRRLGTVASEKPGPLLEGWVFGTLRAHAEHHHLYDDIAYWAPAQSQTEVVSSSPATEGTSPSKSRPLGATTRPWSKASGPSRIWQD